MLAEAVHLEAGDPAPLSALRLGSDAREVRLVYSKGAVVAAHLQRLLRGRGESLDELLRRVVTSRAIGLNSDELAGLARSLHGNAAADELESWVLEGRPAPELTLPPPTGLTDCAKLLPPELAERSAATAAD